MIQQMKKEVEEVGKYQFQEIPQGEGGLGIVVKVQNIHNAEILALKIFNKQQMTRNISANNPDEKQQIIAREILHQKKVSGHPLIVELKEVFLTENFVCIAMEYARGEDLHSYVTKCIANKSALTESEARPWFQQLVIAINFCHKHDINNLSIKLDNVFRVYDEAGPQPGWWGQRSKIRRENQNVQYYLKLCHFGYANFLDKNSAPAQRLSSSAYASPETLDLAPGKICDGCKRDVWSCGVALYYLLTGNYPFDPQQFTMGELFQKIRGAEYGWPRNCRVSQAVKNLVALMLNPNPSNRCSIDDVIRNGWFQVGLPANWNKNFDAQVQEKQQLLQTDEEISKIVDGIIAGVRQNCDDDFNFEDCDLSEFEEE
eukprot:TRINITY_DN3059_c0_g5_i1.p1 TRINITY_DN3059_c0_g5~~TRINITY_DN3059_c0_g5_i1.p1  ORF type:complete len:372 (-),score=41.09 TRINITY_DN3059_c0_g5_i1:462-1577(-)